MNLVRLTAAVDIQAAAAGDGKRRVKIMAYSGGPVAGAAGYPFTWVADLGGMERAATIPLLAEHANTLDALAGSGTTEIVDGSLHIAGELSAPTDAAKKIIAMLDSGTPIQASIGFQVLAAEKYDTELGLLATV